MHEIGLAITRCKDQWGASKLGFLSIKQGTLFDQHPDHAQLATTNRPVQRGRAIPGEAVRIGSRSKE